MFLDVRGEWSLSRVAGIIHSRSYHTDIKKASKSYLLSTLNTEIQESICQGLSFFGYSDSPRTFTDDDYEVKRCIEIFKTHINNIVGDKLCIYPERSRFTYAKYSEVTLSKPSTKNFKRLRVLLDDIEEEANKVEVLLESSKAGSEYYGREIMSDESSEYEVETTNWERTIGSVIKHRYARENLQLLIKWKYLSLEDSTWVEADKISNNIIIKTYLRFNNLKLKKNSDK